ncbi:Nn.00g026310.m01.CDS01 [Neocucurbitaria sp. VM-36]
MSHEDTTMSNAPLTPGDEPEPQNPVVDFSPATVRYDESFENSLMETILNPPEHDMSREPSHEPHMIPASQLPIPLSSHLRTHTSPIPGLYLTHPNGYHTGGPGPASHTVKDFADKFIREHGIEDAGQLERVVEMTVRDKLREVEERMEKRNEAVEKNKGVERELEDLRLQRSAELRVMERVKGGKR